MSIYRPGKGGRRFIVLAVLAVTAIVVAAAGGGAQRVAVRSGVAIPDTLRTPHRQQIVNSIQTNDPNVKFGCQVATFSHTTPCYGPFQMRHAYGTDNLLNAGYDGSGRTIVIIDAYGSPTLASDLATFTALWGLPTANLTVYTPFGIDPTDTNNAEGWSGETTLDVEWAHAIAPGAKIALVIAKSNFDNDILDATQYAVDNNLGDVVSQSFGEAEQCMDPSDLSRQESLFRQAVAKGMTLFASSGDDGAAQPTCDGSDLMKAASTPASDPNVTGVGGTDLLASGIDGTYSSESTWNDEFGGGGGGVSVLYSKPGWQRLAALNGNMREVPDVSYDASVYHGVLTVWTLEGTQSVFRFGGTSAGSPQWAAILAITDQIAGHRLGNINPILYYRGWGRNPFGSIFHDIADGSNNSTTDFEGNPIDGYTAVRGYDMATGLGSPNIVSMVQYLAHSAAR